MRLPVHRPPEPRPVVKLRHALGLLLLVPVVGCNTKATRNDGGGEAAKPGIVASLFGSEFEGELTAGFSIVGKKGPPMQLVFAVKKPKYRVDTSGEGPPSSLLVDPVAKKGTYLSHAQKSGFIIDFEKIKSMPKGGMAGLPPPVKGAWTASSEPPTMEKTGKKDVVAGHACEIWNVASAGLRSEACIAEDIPSVDFRELGWAPPDLAAVALATHTSHFPLRVIGFDAKGVEGSRMEVTSVDRRKLGDARFVAPADYRLIDLASTPQTPALRR